MLLLCLLNRAEPSPETWRGKRIGELTYKEALEALISLGHEYSEKIRVGGSYTPPKNYPTRTRGHWRVIKQVKLGGVKK